MGCGLDGGNAARRAQHHYRQRNRASRHRPDARNRSAIARHPASGRDWPDRSRRQHAPPSADHGFWAQTHCTRSRNHSHLHLGFARRIRGRHALGHDGGLRLRLHFESRRHRRGNRPHFDGLGRIHPQRPRSLHPGRSRLCNQAKSGAGHAVF